MSQMWLSKLHNVSKNYSGGTLIDWQHSYIKVLSAGSQGKKWVWFCLGGGFHLFGFFFGFVLLLLLGEWGFVCVSCVCLFFFKTKCCDKHGKQVG